MATPPVAPANPPNNSPSDDDDKLDKNKNKIPPFNIKKKQIDDEEQSADDLLDSLKPSPIELSRRSSIKEHQKKQDENSDDNFSQSTMQFELAAKHTSEGIAQVSQTAGVNTELLEVAKQVSQYIKEMHVSSVEHQSVTSVIIQSKGIFNNAQVHVVTVGGEHNLIFTHLTQQAQTLLDNREQQSHLRKALDAQGVIVHNIRTERTEQAPLNIPTQSSEQSQYREDDQTGRGQTKKNKNRYQE